MEQIFNLRPRLKAAADFVRKGSSAADIGTDHGYLAAYLVKTGISPRVVAADLRKGPLENAEATVKSLGLENQISLYLSDGLESVPENCADDIVIAGMGGTLIRDILSRCEWIKKDGIRLILQPMSHSYEVRSFLWENGFEILAENAIEDAGRAYCVICAEYSGSVYDYAVGEEYLGKLTECDSEAANRILASSLSHIDKRSSSLEKAGRGEEEIKKLRAAENYMKSVLKFL